MQRYEVMRDIFGPRHRWSWNYCVGLLFSLFSAIVELTHLLSEPFRFTLPVPKSWTEPTRPAVDFRLCRNSGCQNNGCRNSGPYPVELVRFHKQLLFANSYSVPLLSSQCHWHSLCWHSNIGKDSLFWFLLFFIRRPWRIYFLQIYDVTNTTRNSHNVAQHAVGPQDVGPLWTLNVVSGTQGRFDSNANGYSQVPSDNII